MKDPEIISNFSAFTTTWRAELDATFNALTADEAAFLESYGRIAAFNAWREYVLNTRLSQESIGFFLEAQNDALVSHVFARLGSWRSALKSLRSMIENTLFCIYYKDHPVELSLWFTSAHTIAFSELTAYCLRHPLIGDCKTGKHSVELLVKEYATLSRAVHGSAPSFRMTAKGGKTLLWNADRPSVGAWQNREKSVCRGLNLILACLYRSDLQGTSHSGLRSAIFRCVSNEDRLNAKNDLKIAIVEKL